MAQSVHLAPGKKGSTAAETRFSGLNNLVCNTGRSVSRVEICNACARGNSWRGSDQGDLVFGHACISVPGESPVNCPLRSRIRRCQCFN